MMGKVKERIKKWTGKFIVTPIWITNLLKNIIKLPKAA